MLRIKTIYIVCLLFLTILGFALFVRSQVAANGPVKAAQGENEQAMQALVNEVRQLRLAIQRSNLSGYQSQIVIERMRAQQQSVDRLSERLRWAREEVARRQIYAPFQQAEIENRIKEIEANLSESIDAKTRRAREGELELTKQRLGMLAQEETRMRDNESQITSQLQIEQGKLAELNDQLDTLLREQETLPVDNKPPQSGKRP